MHSRGVKPAYAPEPDATACYEVKNPFTLIEYRTADVLWILTSHQQSGCPSLAGGGSGSPLTDNATGTKPLARQTLGNDP
jgi:hypothetical protein